MHMRLLTRPLLSALAALLVITACGASTGPSETGTADLKIMVGGLSKQIYLPNKLAEVLGYFKEQNLNVTLVDEASGQITSERGVGGKAEGAPGPTTQARDLQAKAKSLLQAC